MKAEELPTHFAGFDWAKARHDILVIDSSGIVACFHQHPDHANFVSLPGAGEKLAPRLLAELFSLPGGATEAPRLQVQAGMAPVSTSRARARLAPCAVWPCAGSKSCP
jgi:hypothetical protein